jgi:hypothetical protein
MITQAMGFKYIENIIGTPQNYILAPNGSWHMIYDTAYITRAIILIMTVFVIYGLLLQMTKAFQRRYR